MDWELAVAAPAAGGFPLVAALLFVSALLAPAIAQARDLVVFGEPTLEKALKSVGTLWQTRTGTRVNVFVAPTDLSYAQIERGARCDVIFALAGAATDDAARSKIIHADTIRRALRNSLVLVGSDPSATPRSNATLADIGRLIASKRLAIANPDRDVAGARALDLLRKLGITVDDSSKAVAVAESSAGVVSLLSANKAQSGHRLCHRCAERFQARGTPANAGSTRRSTTWLRGLVIRNWTYSRSLSS